MTYSVLIAGKYEAGKARTITLSIDSIPQKQLLMKGTDQEILKEITNKYYLPSEYQWDMMVYAART